MEAIQQTKEIIHFLDFDPKFSIVERSFNSTIMVWVDPCEGLYSLNTIPHENLNSAQENIKPLAVSVKAVRLRAQVQNPELELFPFVGVDKVGFVRNKLENLMLEEMSLADIDTQIIALIAGNLWRKKKSFLPLIKALIPLDASNIISRVAVLFPGGL